MRLIRCTQNLLKKLKVSSPYTDSFQDAILGDWFANIFRIGRKQCVIFVNEKTLFSFIVYGIRLKPKTLSDAFIRYLKFVLVEEGIPQALVQQICLRYQDIEFAVTNSRSILGSMNDLVFLYRHTVMLNLICWLQLCQSAVPDNRGIRSRSKKYLPGHSTEP